MARNQVGLRRWCGNRAQCSDARMPPSAAPVRNARHPRLPRGETNMMLRGKCSCSSQRDRSKNKKASMYIHAGFCDSMNVPASKCGHVAGGMTT